MFIDETKFTSFMDYLNRFFFIWVVLSPDLSGACLTEHGFVHINLDENFRNSREIVLEAKRVADKSFNELSGRKLLTMPPLNFPRGCHPIHVDSFEDAIMEAVKLTTGGILVNCMYNYASIK